MDLNFSKHLPLLADEMDSKVAHGTYIMKKKIQSDLK